jgi:hypothetical protein
MLSVLVTLIQKYEHQIEILETLAPDIAYQNRVELQENIRQTKYELFRRAGCEYYNNPNYIPPTELPTVLTSITDIVELAFKVSKEWEDKELHAYTYLGKYFRTGFIDGYLLKPAEEFIGTLESKSSLEIKAYEYGHLAGQQAWELHS